MGEVIGNSDVWAWLLQLAGKNMLIAVALTIIVIVFFIVALSVGINQIGKNVFGKQVLVVPLFINWIGRKLVKWIPVLGKRIKTSLTTPPKKPLTKKQRVLSIVFMSIYFMLVIFILFVFYVPNAALASYSTTSKGILVEIQAIRQPTDGFSFDIQFDRPAKVVGVWADIPINKWSTKQFNIHYDEVVNLQDEQQGTLNIVSANYPFATPNRSVYIYFQAVNPNDQQLGFVKMKWEEGEK